MFAKLLSLILITICTALALLSLRQLRIDVVNEMTSVHRSTMQQRRMIWTVRGQLAELLQADHLHALIGDSDDWSILEQPQPAASQARPNEHTDADRG